MKLNEMLSRDIGNLIFVLHNITRALFFFSLRQSLSKVRSISNDSDFSALSEQSLSAKCQERTWVYACKHLWC